MKEYEFLTCHPFFKHYFDDSRTMFFYYETPDESHSKIMIYYSTENGIYHNSIQMGSESKTLNRLLNPYNHMVSACHYENKNGVKTICHQLPFWLDSLFLQASIQHKKK